MSGPPPLPKPQAAPETITIELTLPGDLLDDLKVAAKNHNMDLDTAVGMCIQLWRYPPDNGAPVRRRRSKRA